MLIHQLETIFKREWLWADNIGFHHILLLLTTFLFYHSLFLPAKEHTTKLMKLQHFFKLRNAYFSGQCSPPVSSETTLVFKWLSWVWRNGLAFQSNLQRCMRVTPEVLVFLKLTGKVAIVSINVCLMLFDICLWYLISVMLVTPKIVEINFMLDLHRFRKVWAGSSHFWIYTFSSENTLKYPFCIGTEKLPLFPRCDSISKIKILLSLFQFF